MPRNSTVKPVSKLPNGKPPRIANIKRLDAWPKSFGSALDWSNVFAEVLPTAIEKPPTPIRIGSPENHGTNAQAITVNP